MISSNIRVLSAVANRLITGGYPPSANVYNIAEIRVCVSLNVCSFFDISRAEIMNKLHDNTGITKNAKYMNDNMYGVMAVKSAKSVYVSFL